MASEPARPRAPPFIDPPGYARHRPEATLLYQTIERRYPEFVTSRRPRRPLPNFVQEEFEAYLKCGRLEHGFLRAGPAARAESARRRHASVCRELGGLGLDWENVISVHAPNPDRPITRRDILATLGR